jgi:putative ATP-dependent endonuclease of the OLD family
MEFLDALRDAKVHLSAGGKNTLLYNILNSQTENKISDLKSNLLKLKELVKEENSVFTTIQKEIEKYLKRISVEDEEGLINFQFSGLETSEILKRMGLLYGSEPISIERNGLGRNNLLYISLLLSQLLKDADKKKVYFRLIGIEEPEAHLHPLLQVHLSRNIDIEQSKERQVLITSHSTHITSQLSLEETIVLHKDGGEIKPYYLLKNLPKASKRYLQKYLDATKSTMFFARKIILVEGISEQLVIPEFFKLHTGDTLEKKNISIVNVDSVAFEHFLSVIKNGYFIKCLVLTDSDSDKQTKHRVPTLKRAYKEISQINIVESLQTTYEKDLIIENATDKGKDILLETLMRTRRNNGKKLKESLGDNPIIDIEAFFLNIYKEKAENYKAEFAMNLVDVLQDDKFNDKINGFNIPKYIKDGFEFLIKKNE